MDLKKISAELSVGSQLISTDMDRLKSEGFRAIICNRPDGEAPDQPSFEMIEKAAKQAGLMIRYVPVQPGNISDQDVADFGQAMAELPRPLLAYCRSGGRASMLWSRYQAMK